MINLYIIVEGDSEEKFVKEILSSYFWEKNIFLHPEKVITGRNRFGKSCKGGGNSYKLYKNHIVKQIKQFARQKSYYFSTMIDLYALPSDFPKLTEAKRYYQDKYRYIEFLENAFSEDIGSKKFIPYIQLHEYETLLFSNIEAIADEYFDLEDDKLLQTIKDDISPYENIELINDSNETAPSKRLDRYTNGNYCGQKTVTSINILKKIGLSVIRTKCKHFDSWLQKIESLASDG